MRTRRFVAAFANVDAGTDTLEVRMLGYERMTRSATVTRGQTLDLTIEF